ncbi:MAG: Re/Si-specific NAD(P)(+) transhydrogenase subunit alpha [Deltaproteobacteria bacterium]|nr:Re/Si-specific NAD(P)(+) transhydrogenase subunit alpha [Deltaproteobacteria bacterium]
MLVGVPKESFAGENRVALIPAVIPQLTKQTKLEVLVETGAGLAAGLTDQMYLDKGAKIVSRQEVFEKADIITQVRTLGANLEGGKADLPLLKPNQIVIGFADPLSKSDAAQAYADKGAILVAMELIPRITRAQSMDALSSMATIAGYKAVLSAAMKLPKMFPMMMTAAGTLAPAKVFVIGVGVAGLQACATAKRLGAVVSAYDVRPAVKDQVQSVGAKFVELEVDAGQAEDKGGYAKALGEEFYRKQRELMAKVVAESDIVITTAAIPGKKSPVLVTADMVKGMVPGSVIVDLAAERGGNCELTKADEEVDVGGVTIYGPTNIATTVPQHASQMYSKNVATLLGHLVNKEGALKLDMADEITSGVVVTYEGKVVHARVREILGMAPAEAAGDKEA